MLPRVSALAIPDAALAGAVSHQLSCLRLATRSSNRHATPKQLAAVRYKLAAHGSPSTRKSPGDASRSLAKQTTARTCFVMRRLVCFAFAVLGACSGETLAPLPLHIGIEASRTAAAPGDSISFLVTAQGGQLVGIVTAYGDGTEDQLGTGGARTARVTFRHAFSSPGTYEVRATVTDAVAGLKDASVSVRVD